MGVKRAAAAALLLAASSCRESAPVPDLGATSASASAAPKAALVSAQRMELAAIEHRRASALIVDEHISSRNVETRRAAARALARIADDRSVELLQKLLADEDSGVVAWAAYGLGYACQGHASENVRALVVRAASLGPKPTAKKPVDANRAIAFALARCGTREAERTLRSWVSVGGPRAEVAALALGRIASAQKRLDDASLIALLDAASDDEPLSGALFAFTRLRELPPNIQRRLLEVATDSLEASGQRRVFAVRALASAGESAAEALSEILSDKKADASERSDAAHGLGRLGETGQQLLGEKLASLIPEDTSKLSTANFGPLVATLGALKSPLQPTLAALQKIADLELPEGGSDTQRRRGVTLRCQAASILAKKATHSKRLAACDPEDAGRQGALAMASVLDRGTIVGGRFGQWKKLVESEDHVVRERALALMPSHPEIKTPHVFLTAGLQAEQAGVVATAANVLASYPDRASARRPRKLRRVAGDPAATAHEEALDPDRSLVDALTAAFEKKRSADDIEVRAELMSAAAAIQLLRLKPKIEPYCKSANPTLRKRAQQALRLLGNKSVTCNEFTPPKDPPPELAHVVATKTRLTFVTDSGELSMLLDPELAPVAVTRTVDLARDGFYDGVVIHRVVPGFVVQLGDRLGDGYGGAGKEPMACETSPVEFDRLTVGVALGGRDTGSSQLFVTLATFPHLTGDYPLIGTATGDWAAVAQGDVIQKVRVEEE